MFLSQIDFQRKSSAKGCLVKDGKTRPNYDTFPSKEVEGRLVGRQDIGASTAATCFSSKKSSGDENARRLIGAIGRGGGEAAKAFFEQRRFSLLRLHLLSGQCLPSAAEICFRASATIDQIKIF